MLLLLAESKTMSAHQLPIDPEEYLREIPVLEPVADAIMHHMEMLTPDNIAEILSISRQLAVKAHSLAYEFPYKHTGYKAIKAFTGEAYRGLDVETLSQEALQRADHELRIISSVYGILKPGNIIKPYRCEFNKCITPSSKTPIQVFKPKVTIETVNYIKENKVADIIDLLPADADKCLDWKIIRAFASVHKICFQTITTDGTLKTPIAKRLKELRGKMAREILTEGISSFKELITHKSDNFVFSPGDSRPGLPVFISD